MLRWPGVMILRTIGARVGLSIVARSDPDFAAIGEIIKMILGIDATIRTRGRRVGRGRNARNHIPIPIPDLLSVMIAGFTDILPNVIAFHQRDKDILSTAHTQFCTIRRRE